MAHVRDKDRLQIGPSFKVEPALSRIQDSQLAFQVALLAHAIPLGPRKLGRIYYRTGNRVFEVSFNRSVATFTGNRLESRLTESIAAPGDEIRRAGVAKYAAFRDRVREVQHGLRLIAGRQVPGPSLVIKRDWGLEQVIADSHQVTVAGFAVSDSVGHRILQPEPVGFQSLEHAAVAMLDEDSGRRGFVIDPAVRLRGVGAQGSLHRRAPVRLHFAGMAGCAAVPRRGSQTGRHKKKNEGQGEAEVQAES